MPVEGEVHTEFSVHYVLSYSVKSSIAQLCTEKSRFNESRFNIKSQFKVQNLVTEMEFPTKMSRFSIKSRFKESKCAY